MIQCYMVWLTKYSAAYVRTFYSYANILEKLSKKRLHEIFNFRNMRSLKEKKLISYVKVLSFYMYRDVQK